VAVPVAGCGFGAGGFSPFAGLAVLASVAGCAGSEAAVPCSVSAETAGAALAAGAALGAVAGLAGGAESAGATALKCSSMCTGGVSTVLCGLGVGGASDARGLERPMSTPPIPTARMTAAIAARFPRLLEGAGGAVSEASSVVWMGFASGSADGTGCAASAGASTAWGWSSCGSGGGLE
jgi:hypothetical protein